MEHFISLAFDWMRETSKAGLHRKHKEYRQKSGASALCQCSRLERQAWPGLPVSISSVGKNGLFWTIPRWTSSFLSLAPACGPLGMMRVVFICRHHPSDNTHLNDILLQCNSKSQVFCLPVFAGCSWPATRKTKGTFEELVFLKALLTFFIMCVWPVNSVSQDFDLPWRRGNWGTETLLQAQSHKKSKARKSTSVCLAVRSSLQPSTALSLRCTGCFCIALRGEHVPAAAWSRPSASVLSLYSQGRKQITERHKSEWGLEIVSLWWKKNYHWKPWYIANKSVWFWCVNFCIWMNPMH